MRRGELTAVEGERLAAGLTVYDAMYLALAVRLQTGLITADDRLGRLVAAHPMTAAHVRLIKTFE